MVNLKELKKKLQLKKINQKKKLLEVKLKNCQMMNLFIKIHYFYKLIILSKIKLLQKYFLIIIIKKN